MLPGYVYTHQGSRQQRTAPEEKIVGSALEQKSLGLSHGDFNFVYCSLVDVATLVRSPPALRKRRRSATSVESILLPTETRLISICATKLLPERRLLLEMQRFRTRDSIDAPNEQSLRFRRYEETRRDERIDRSSIDGEEIEKKEKVSRS